jgi:hypothetical protein
MRGASAILPWTWMTLAQLSHRAGVTRWSRGLLSAVYACEYQRELSAAGPDRRFAPGTGATEAWPASGD